MKLMEHRRKETYLYFGQESSRVIEEGTIDKKKIIISKISGILAMEHHLQGDACKQPKYGPFFKRACELTVAKSAVPNRDHNEDLVRVYMRESKSSVFTQLDHLVKWITSPEIWPASWQVFSELITVSTIQGKWTNGWAHVDTTGSRTKRCLTPSLGMCPAKIWHKSLEPSNSEGAMQNERDLTLKLSSTVKVGEVLGQLVQEIKEIQVQLQCVSANIALHSEVLGQTHMDCGCRMCWGNIEHSRGEAEADKSDMQESQSPSTRPLYYV